MAMELSVQHLNEWIKMLEFCNNFFQVFYFILLIFERKFFAILNYDPNNKIIKFEIVNADNVEREKVFNNAKRKFLFKRDYVLENNPN